VVRLVLILCALFASAVVAAGCGGMQGNAVAEVDGEPVEKTAFDHWMVVAAKASEQGQQGAEVPQEQLRDQVLQLLVSHEWIRGEAEELGVEVSDDEVRDTYNQQKEQSFPEDADFEKFLKDSAQTEEDLLLQVRIDLLSTKISEEVTKGDAPVTEAQIEEFYNENKDQFDKQSLEQATETIRQTLQSQNQQQALQEFGEEFQRKWRERTDCREEFATSACKNGPDPTPTPTPTPVQPG
jgi:foldase protein PrsA